MTQGNTLLDESTRESHLEDMGGNLRFLQALLHECPIGSESRVLEIGCGTGVLACYLAKCTGATVIGTEQSWQAAQIASTRVRCLWLTDGSLPNEDFFDLIYCKDVLPMINDKPNFFTSARRLLRPGGAFASYIPEVTDFIEKPLYHFIPSSRERSMERYGPISAVIHGLQDSGFLNVHIFRLFLGTIPIGFRYIDKHMDGFFSNTEGSGFDRNRRNGLSRLRMAAEDLGKHGMLLHYQWERAAVIAR
jgi:SAM-dependent methyltransferase